MFRAGQPPSEATVRFTGRSRPTSGVAPTARDPERRFPHRECGIGLRPWLLSRDGSDTCVQMALPTQSVPVHTAAHQPRGLPCSGVSYREPQASHPDRRAPLVNVNRKGSVQRPHTPKFLYKTWLSRGLSPSHRLWLFSFQIRRFHQRRNPQNAPRGRCFMLPARNPTPRARDTRG